MQGEDAAFSDKKDLRTLLGFHQQWRENLLTLGPDIFV